MPDIVERLRDRWERMGDSAGKKINRILIERRDAADEIENLRASVERKQQQYERAQRYWVDAAQKALAGDAEHLRLRVDLALSGPIEMTETN